MKTFIINILSSGAKRLSTFDFRPSTFVFYTFILLYFLTFLLAFASNPRDKILESQVKNSGEYRWGEAIDADRGQAKEWARRDLCQKIYVAITSSSDRTISESNAELSDTTTIKTQTYSALNLQNLNDLVLDESNQYRVVAYIDTASLNKSFEESKQKVSDIVNLALQAESEGRIGDALKMLYWAYLLTHTYCGELNLEFEGIDVLDARLAISEKMIRIIKNISVTAEPCYRKAGSVNSTLSFYYNDKPIQNLEFGYQCGEGDEFGYIDNGSSETITLYHDINSRTYPLWISIEYIYLGQMRRKPEILNLYEIFKNKELDLSICVELTAPWVAGKKEKKKPVVIPPPPVKTGFSTTIEILADIKEKSEFDEALHDYNRSGKIIIARERSSIPSGNNIFVVILDETKKKELLFLTNGKYQSVKTRKIYSDYHDAYTGDAMVIWLGEPIR